MPLVGFGVACEKCVAKAKQLHDTLILTKIFMTFKNESISSPIAAIKAKLSRSLLGRNDAKVALKIENPDDRLATLVSSGYDQVEISSIEKLGRYIGKFQIIE